MVVTLYKQLGWQRIALSLIKQDFLKIIELAGSIPLFVSILH